MTDDGEWSDYDFIENSFSHLGPLPQKNPEITRFTECFSTFTGVVDELFWSMGKTYWLGDREAMIMCVNSEDDIEHYNKVIEPFISLQITEPVSIEDIPWRGPSYSICDDRIERYVDDTDYDDEDYDDDEDIDDDDFDESDPNDDDNKGKEKF